MGSSYIYKTAKSFCRTWVPPYRKEKERQRTFTHPGISTNDYQGENIASITDGGLGDFTFTFDSPLDQNTLVVSPIGDTPPFKVLSATGSAVRVKFDKEPPIVRIRFDSR